MNFKTLTIILGVVVASIVLGTSVISGDIFGKVAAIKATHQPDAELKSDAVDELLWWKYDNCCYSLFDRIVDSAPAYLPVRSLGLR